MRNSTLPDSLPSHDDDARLQLTIMIISLFACLALLMGFCCALLFGRKHNQISPTITHRDPERDQAIERALNLASHSGSFVETTNAQTESPGYEQAVNQTLRFQSSDARALSALSGPPIQTNPSTLPGAIYQL